MQKTLLQEVGKGKRLKGKGKYQTLNFDQIVGFEDQGRVISKEEQALLV
ncbi:MAG: hypothetical protein RM338_09615 [Nostoc sp. DedQUE12a]|nr:hypothetical protein [Nostoc sp. DedQUE12a]